MNMNQMLDKRLFELTVAEFLEVINSSNNGLETNNPVQTASITESEYVYGIGGLAKFLGCSKNHIGKLKKDGIFSKAMHQKGRKIITNKKLALEAFNDYKQK